MRGSDAVLTTANTVCKAARASLGDLPLERWRRVVVTGLGLVTPLGVGVPQAWTNLLSGTCGIRCLEPKDFVEAEQPAFESLPAKIAATICMAELEASLATFGIDKDRAHSKFISYALLAAEEALQDAKYYPEMRHEREATGVAIGSAMSATAGLGAAGLAVTCGRSQRLSPYLVPRTLANMAAGAVSMRHGLLGPNHCVSTACATGTHAIGDAFNLIRLGHADTMLAGASEACIDAIAIGAFSRMRALETRYNDSPAKSCRPFDVDRGGFVMGEGAGVLVLEELEHARARGAHIYAEMRGYGLSADAHHITQPALDGRGAKLAMTRALQSSMIDPSEVAYVNAHATSTPTGDAVEAAAIAEVFGVDRNQASEQSAPPGESNHVLVSSTKGATGHLLGAAGAVEAIFSILALRDRTAPPTLNLGTEEPATLGPVLVAQQARRLPSRASAVLSNSFGFGGTNASIMFASTPAV